MTAGANDGNYSTKELFVSFEIDLCFRKIPEISLVGNLPPLVGAYIVYTITASNRAHIASCIA